MEESGVQLLYSVAVACRLQGAFTCTLWADYDGYTTSACVTLHHTLATVLDSQVRHAAPAITSLPGHARWPFRGENHLVEREA